MKHSVRPIQPEDLTGVLDVLSAAMPGDPVSLPRFVRQVLLDPNFVADGALVAREGPVVVGFCLSMARQIPLENAPPDSDRGYITLIGVHPNWQRQGIGTALIRAAEAYLRTQNRWLALVSPYSPGYFIPGVDVTSHAGALSFFSRHGYKEQYRALSMETSLWSLEPPEWMKSNSESLDRVGIRCETYTPELTLPLLHFVQTEFPGDWVRVVREAMLRIQEGASAGRLIVAHHYGKVLGFSHHDNERFGPIGTAVSERGRGLGHLLMFRTLRVMQEEGFRSAWFLWSDDRTARRLYVAASFKEVRRFAILRKELSN